MDGRVPVGRERETAACVTCRGSGYRERVDVVEWYDVVGRLCLAALLGGLLGLEREFDGHDAGLRTHLLVTLGAALFSLTSVAGFDAYVSAAGTTNVTIDITRIASYVAPGVGFIGGGAILKHEQRVTGITTAASLWTAAAIGVATGVGFWVAAVTTTVLGLLALELLMPLSEWAAENGRQRGRRASGERG